MNILPIPLAMIVTCLALPVAVAAPGADHPLLPDRLLPLVRKHFPDAQVTRDDGGLTAKHGTMLFTVHRELMTGEILEKTHQVEGPNFRGFLLTVSRRNGKYDGQAIVPQTLREPYWRTFIDAPATEDGKGHYVVHFSYGSRLDPEFTKALFEVLPKSSPPSTTSNATSAAEPAATPGAAVEAVQE